MFCSRICHTSLRDVSSLSAERLSYFIKGAAPSNSSLFALYPFFFNFQEQRLLLQSCLKKLDSVDSRRARKRRISSIDSQSVSHPLPSPDPSPRSITELFRPDNLYEFQEGHYDGVISNFREMHVTSWPTEDATSLYPILDRVKGLVPDVKTQTHILHLGSDGEIFPHVDNLDASGSWIVGVSLGSPRVLRIEKVDDSNDSFDVLLPSGSVYIQRDDLRYNYKHSILRQELFRGEVATGGQRISVMLRVCSRLRLFFER
ncbi:hypothetical protein M0805_008985 [Coniferiporia weirii]|nr:hypothetical protein M0805_008985 [Coniferiporia weirii]